MSNSRFAHLVRWFFREERELLDGLRQEREELTAAAHAIELGASSDSSEDRHWVTPGLAPPDAADVLSSSDRFIIWTSARPGLAVIALVSPLLLGLLISLAFWSMAPAVFAALAWIVLLMFGRNLLSLAAPSRTGILFLRRFHREQFPAYPVSRVVDELVFRGYEAVTLRDSVIQEDGSTAVAVSALIGGAIGMVIGYVLAFSAAFAGVISVGFAVYQLGLAAQSVVTGLVAVPRELTFLAAAGLVLVPLLYTWQRFKQLRRWAWMLIAGPVFLCTEGVLSLWNWLRRVPQSPSELTLRRPGQLAMTVFAADDALWQQSVATLMDRCEIVLIDVSDPSPNISWEIGALSQRQRSCLPIWLRHAGTASPIEKTSSGYRIHGAEFKGVAIELTYPVDAPLALYHAVRMPVAAVDPASPYQASIRVARTIEAARRSWSRLSPCYPDKAAV